MSDLAVIKATFSDWRTVKGRKQLQLIFEVPLEQQREVLARLGAPNSENPLWCAIAMLSAEAATKPVDLSKSERGKEMYRSKDAMEQAAIRACILCDDMRFQLWASKYSIPGAHSTAAEWLRAELRVKSRNEISSNERAYKSFLAIEEEYKQAAGLAAEVR